MPPPRTPPDATPTARDLRRLILAAGRSYEQLRDQADARGEYLPPDINGTTPRERRMLAEMLDTFAAPAG